MFFEPSLFLLYSAFASAGMKSVISSPQGYVGQGLEGFDDGAIGHVAIACG